MDNIIHFPVIARPIPAGPVSPLPAFLHVWRDFITVVEPEDEVLPIRGRATDDGPQIEFDGHFVQSIDIEQWDIAILWLSPCLLQIAGTVLAESLAAKDGVGRFHGPRWIAFRREAVRTTGFDTWGGLLDAARREGVDFTADHITGCMIAESHLATRLESA